MKRTVKFAALLLGGILAISSSASAAIVIVDKTPDVGPYWLPLAGGPPGGTYVYANSFIFGGTTGTLMETVGVWLQNIGAPDPNDPFGPAIPAPGSLFRYEIYADNSNTPTGALLESTAYMQAANTTLQLVTGLLGNAVSLTNGTRYWIAASTVGQANQGRYQVGGHTNNSGPYDNPSDSFWFTNYSNGSFIDNPQDPGVGGPLTPEMAIYAEGREPNPSQGVPEPGSLAIWGLGFLACVAGVRRRKVVA